MNVFGDAGATAPADQTQPPAAGDVLTPDQVLAERERVLADREAELQRREQAFNAAPAPAALSAAESADQAVVQARIDAGYYCPACGLASKYPRECFGQCAARPGLREAVEFVSTDELKNAPDPVNKAAYAEWQSKHTPAPASENAG